MPNVSNMVLDNNQSIKQTGRQFWSGLTVFIFILTSLSGFSNRPQHIRLAYKHQGGDDYEITAYVVEECNAWGTPTQLSFALERSCQPTQSYGLPRQYNSDLTNYASSVLTTCQSPNSNFKGYSLAIYRACIPIANSCSNPEVRLILRTCCRNSQPFLNITNNQIVAYAKINLDEQPTTPLIDTSDTHLPIKRLCGLRQNTFSIAPSWQTEDSLVYSVDSFASGYNFGAKSIQTIPYGFGYSNAQPTDGFSMNPYTGVVSIAPLIGTNVNVAYAVNFRISMYNRCTGQLKGYFNQEQWLLMNIDSNCYNPITTGITNLDNNSISVDSLTISSQVGDSICFDVIFTHPDTMATLVLRENINNNWPSAAVTTVGTNPLTVNVCGVNDIDVTKLTQKLTVTQTGPVTIQSTQFTYSIYNRASPKILVSDNYTVCPGESATIKARGAPNFKWYELNAGVLNLVSVGAEFSCNNCSDPVVSPLSSKTYVVQGDTTGQSGFCGIPNLSSDTVMVNVSTGFITSVSNTVSKCYGDSFALAGFATVPIFNAYWQGKISRTILNGASVKWQQNYSDNWVFHATSNNGCIQTDTVAVNIGAPLPTKVGTLEDTICLGDVIKIRPSYTFDTLDCGSDLPCSLLDTIAIGDTTNWNFNSPFALGIHTYYFAVSASELVNLGLPLSGASIGSIGFVFSNAAGTFNNLELEMRCVSGATVGKWRRVLYMDTFTHSSRFVTLNFDNHFTWNGTDTLEFRINQSTNISNSSGFRGINNPPIQSSYAGTNLFACSNSSYFSNINFRPYFSLGYCTSENLANLQYNWSGPGGLSIANSMTSAPSLSSAAVGNYPYFLTISDGMSCSRTDTFNLQVDSLDIKILSPDGICNTSGLTTLQGYPAGGIWYGGGVTNPAVGTFDPSIITGPTSILYQKNGFCGGSVTKIITVGEPLDPSINSQPVCSGANQYNFSPTSFGGIWSAANLIDSVTGQFSPNQWGVGTHQINYVVNDICTTSTTDTFIIYQTVGKPVLFQVGSEIETDSVANFYRWKTKNNTVLTSTIPVFPSSNILKTGDTVVVCVPDSNGCETSSEPLIYSRPVGRAEVESGQVSIYPNPAHGSLQIEQPDLHFERFSLVDLQGKVLLNEPITSNIHMVQLLKFSEGVYQLILHGDELSQSFPLVIQ